MGNTFNPDDRHAIGLMDDTELVAEAHRLIDLGVILVPEGEGLDLTDQDYELADVARIKRTLSTMRKAIDIGNAALAQYWHSKWPRISQNLDGSHWWLSPNRGWRIRPDASLAFATWLKEQDVEVIEKIVSPTGVRVGPIGKGERDTFLTNEATNDALRIQSKPTY